jgi:hypothetical protein
MKKYFAKQGVEDFNELMFSTLNNPKNIIGSRRIGDSLGGVIAVILFCCFNLFDGLFKKGWSNFMFSNAIYTIGLLILLLIPSIFINNYLLFKNKKYLFYFKNFEVYSGKKKIVFALLCILIFPFVFGLFILSLLAT